MLASIGINSPYKRGNSYVIRILLDCVGFDSYQLNVTHKDLLEVARESDKLVKDADGST